MSNTLQEVLAEVDGNPSRLSLGRSVPHDKPAKHRYEVFVSNGIYVIIEDGLFLVDLFTATETNGRFWRGNSISHDTRIPISDASEYLVGFERAYSFSDKFLYRDHSFHEVVERVASRSPLPV